MVRKSRSRMCAIDLHEIAIAGREETPGQFIEPGTRIALAGQVLAVAELVYETPRDRKADTRLSTDPSPAPLRHWLVP